MEEEILKKARYAHFRIENDSDDLFVLRANTFGAFVGTAILLPLAAAFLAAAYFGGRKEKVLLFLAGSVGLLLLLGGLATFRRALFNRDRIMFDRAKQEVRLKFLKKSRNRSIPYSSLKNVKMTISKSSSTHGGTSRAFQLDLVEQNGETAKINKSEFVDDMLRLGSHVGRLCGVPFDSVR
jgi:hypothetical protein